jgi:hypothetical protein
VENHILTCNIARDTCLLADHDPNPRYVAHYLAIDPQFAF